MSTSGIGSNEGNIPPSGEAGDQQWWLGSGTAPIRADDDFEKRLLDEESLPPKEAAGNDDISMWNPRTSHADVNKGLRTPATFTLPRTSFGGVYHALDSWEGIVLDLSGGEVRARLMDPQKKRNDEEVEFSIQEIPPIDRDLLKPGATFHWTIGHSDSVIGLRSRISQIRFQRLPGIQQVDLDRSRIRADKLEDLFR